MLLSFGLKMLFMYVSSRIQPVTLEFLHQIVALGDLLLFQLEHHGISTTFSAVLIKVYVE